MSKQSIAVVLVMVAACGDDASTSDGESASGSTTTTSSGASACTVSIHDGPKAPCPSECPHTTYGTEATFCTVGCTGPDDPCPEGTQCFQNAFGDYTTCMPPCAGGTCPDKMRCSSIGGGDRCLPK